MEWEHIVTVEQLIEHRPCFKQKPCTGPDGEAYGGAKCCDESDELYIKMVSDLQNLVPSVGELNGVRANLPFGEVPGERREFGACDAPGVRGLPPCSLLRPGPPASGGARP